MKEKTRKNFFCDFTIITAGSTYLDIDAYACCVAMEELLRLKGLHAIAYSKAPCNYSVVKSLIKEGQIKTELPTDLKADDLNYIIVDVSDPDYIKDSVSIENVIEVYDHHVGFEDYWTSRIGDDSHIEFIGAAATLIYREWKKYSLQDKMSRPTALLLIAAILDNTLSLTSKVTTDADIEAFKELCVKENITDEWCASYFSEVQASIEADLKNALFSDIKTIRNNDILPSRVAQIAIWDAQNILNKLPQIRQWFAVDLGSWMINVIDIKNNCSYFVCDDEHYQKEIARVFGVDFDKGVAKSSISYLRKEIIKKTVF